MPLIGDKFPEMEVMTTHGKKKLPKDFKRQWFVFFSHPADFTPVCTTEFVAFAKRYEEFQKLECFNAVKSLKNQLLTFFNSNAFPRSSEIGSFNLVWWIS